MDLKQVGYRAYEGSYRGKHVRIWGEHADGGFGRIQRWWNYETCGHTETGINELEAAKRQARSTINQELDGRADYRFMWRDLFSQDTWHDLFSGEPPADSFPEETWREVPKEPEKKALMREKLKRMTVENGCTEAEAATAKRLLEEL